MSLLAPSPEPQQTILGILTQLLAQIVDLMRLHRRRIHVGRDDLGKSAVDQKGGQQWQTHFASLVGRLSGRPEDRQFEHAFGESPE